MILIRSSKLDTDVIVPIVHANDNQLPCALINDVAFEEAQVALRRGPATHDNQRRTKFTPKFTTDFTSLMCV